MRHGRALWSALLVGVALFALPRSALAYVGPGIGLTAIGTFLAFVAVVFLGIVGFLWYPIRRLLRGRGAKARSSAENAAPASRAEHEPPQ